MKKIDSVCMLIRNKIMMFKAVQEKYNNPYGSDVAIDVLEELLNEIEEFSAKTEEE